MHIDITNPQTFDGAAAIFITAFPERRREVDAWHHGEDRWVATLPELDEVVGYAAAWKTRPSTYHMDLVVAPRWRRQRIGTRLLETIIQYVQGQGGTVLHARARDTFPDAMHFLVKHGFRETIRTTTLDLDLKALEIDLDVYRRAVQLPEGIVITTLASEQADPACWKRIRAPTSCHPIQHRVRESCHAPYQSQVGIPSGLDGGAIDADVRERRRRCVWRLTPAGASMVRSTALAEPCCGSLTLISGNIVAQSNEKVG